jgi:hypothetical protein
MRIRAYASDYLCAHGIMSFEAKQPVVRFVLGDKACPLKSIAIVHWAMTERP